jgi:hypothetical protein
METNVAFKTVIASMFLINLYQADESDERTNSSAPSLSRYNTHFDFFLLGYQKIKCFKLEL